jgi:ribosomal protein L22
MVRKAIAQTMVQSAYSAPHVSVFVDVDATRTMEFVKRLKASPDFAGVRVSPRKMRLVVDMVRGRDVDEALALLKFTPNKSAIDDQARRARIVAQRVPAVVSSCETPAQRAEAVSRWLALVGGTEASGSAVDLNGAELATEEILSLTD